MLQFFNQPPVAAAGVCFCELLGVCSLQLRVDVRALNMVLQHRNTHTAEGQQAHTLGIHAADTHPKHATYTVCSVSFGTLMFLLFSASSGVKLAEGELGAAEELIGYLEAAVMEQVEQKGLSRWSG